MDLQNQQQYACSQTQPKQMQSSKDQFTALILCIFLGMFGAHQFYARKYVLGVLYLFSCGAFLIMWPIDVIRILLGIFKDDKRLPINNRNYVGRISAAFKSAYNSARGTAGKVADKSPFAHQCVRCGKSGARLELNQQGLCIDCERQVTTQYISELTARLTPEQQNIDVLNAEIQKLNQQINQSQMILQQQTQAQKRLQDEAAQLNAEIKSKRDSIIELDEAILVQEFGLYEPTYDFCHAESYKLELSRIRQQQKDMVKQNIAVTGNSNWTVNGNLSQGKKMVKDMQKLLLRAFNSECDSIVAKVKYSNFEASKKRICASCDAISKLGAVMRIAITQSYMNLKISELTLAFEYQLKKQEEKEAQREARAKMREEAKLQKEIEEARRKVEKEQTHYETALSKISLQIDSASPDELPELLNKKAEIENHLSKIDKSIADIDYREANQRAGYVYVISNIGSFGENIYKIGMTRRLDPTERVDELGDASVPFNFDIHAMIFSDDAPALEAALHRAFDDRKLNMVNKRREFFNVTLDEIKAVVKQNYDKTAEFIDVANAEQFRVSQKMRQQIAANED